MTPALGTLTIWLANASAAGPISIQEAIDQALANHPSLKTAAARVQAAQASTRALWESYAPQVTLFAGAQRNQVSGTTTRIGITNETAGYAERNWREAQARERNRLGSSTDTSKAYSLLYDARVSLIQASYDVKVAEARLERSIGADF